MIPRLVLSHTHIRCNSGRLGIFIFSAIDKSVLSNTESLSTPLHSFAFSFKPPNSVQNCWYNWECCDIPLGSHFQKSSRLSLSSHVLQGHGYRLGIMPKAINAAFKTGPRIFNCSRCKTVVSNPSANLLVTPWPTIYYG